MGGCSVGSAAAGAATGGVGGLVIAACPGACASTFAGCVHVTTVCLVGCFDDDSLVSVLHPSGLIAQTRIQDVVVGQQVLTLDGEMVANKVTDVISNEKLFGPYTHVIVSVSDTIANDELIITESHKMVVIRGNVTALMPAIDMRLGDQLVLHNNGAPRTALVTGMRSVQKPHTFQLMTRDGTVLANDVYTTTVCDSWEPPDEDAALALSHWQEEHSHFMHTGERPTSRTGASEFDYKVYKAFVEHMDFDGDGKVMRNEMLASAYAMQPAAVSFDALDVILQPLVHSPITNSEFKILLASVIPSLADDENFVELNFDLDGNHKVDPDEVNPLSVPFQRRYGTLPRVVWQTQGALSM